MSLIATVPGDVSPAASILVVEDDASMTRLLRHLLTSRGYRVRLAESIAAARVALAAEPADLVVLDRRLPDGDGMELARELQSGPSYAYLLMLSAHSSDAAKIDGFASGADDYVTKPFRAEELLARVRAGLRIVDLQKALVASNRRLEALATTDGLTGVRNRRWFDEELERAFALSARYERPLALVIFDVDHFKNINDAHGHLAGDAVLREIALRASGVLRKTDFLARVGGEEFAALLPEGGLFEGLQVAEKIRAAIADAPIDAGAGFLGVTISAGVASVPHTVLHRPQQMVWCADQALYRAKRRGRDRVELERRSNPWRSPKESRANASAVLSDVRQQAR